MDFTFLVGIFEGSPHQNASPFFHIFPWYRYYHRTNEMHKGLYIQINSVTMKSLRQTVGGHASQQWIV